MSLGNGRLIVLWPHMIQSEMRIKTLTIIMTFAALLLRPVFLYAAIDPQYGFESGVPAFVKTLGRGQVESSDEKFKDGSKSLKFSWLGQAALDFSNFTEIEASMKVAGAGVIVWIYNTAPMNAPLTITFKGWDNKEICHFDFNMDFKGWRTAWIKYIDMRTPDGGHYGDVKANERNTKVAKMTVTAPRTVPSGTIYIDRLSFTKTKMHDQITPDAQIPENNWNLARNMWHWCRLWEWEQYPALQPAAVTEAQKKQLAAVEAEMDNWAKNGNPSDNYVKNTLVPRADAAYEKYRIQRLADGSVTGAPLLSDDEFNNAKGEMRIRFVQEIVYWYTLDYLYTGNTANLPKIFNAFDHAIDQGWAYGSGMGTNHHYGYQIRDLYKALWILRDEIAKAGKTEEYVKVLEYWSGVAEARKPFQYGRDELLDSWHTLNDAKCIAIMMMPDDGMRYAYMKAFSQWLSGSLGFSPGTLGGLKVDGTSFHHGGHYPAYSVGAFAALGNFCRFTLGTDFVLSVDARKNFKYALMTLRNYCNTRDWGFGVSGRHPFGGNIPDADANAYARLALCGDLTKVGTSGDGTSGVDPELGGAYLALGAPDKELANAIRKAGITELPAADGFYVYNYGAFGIHRRNGWMLTLKGYNSDVWGSEIYAADNRYGRYISYGSVQLYGPDQPVSAKTSGYVQEGWDWNHFPATTAICLPYELLESPLKGTLMERNVSRFPGVSSLEGKNGCLAFTYVEKDRVNFCAGATATKSVFCFDNRIVFIGTGITNSSSYPTHTTLYQNHLDSKDEEIDINEDYTGAFPYSYRESKDGRMYLMDNKKNAYFLKNGYGVVVSKASNTSPLDTKRWAQAANGGMKTGEFATAYIDHGASPKNASYEYMMVVKPNAKEIKAYKKAVPYIVLQADNDAHVVKDNVTGITGYIIYKTYSNAATLLSSADAETIVMERTAEDGSVVMSVCTPDLGITEKAYTTPQPSQPVVKIITLNGKYGLQGDCGNVKLDNGNGNTRLTVTCINGQPVEFHLRKQ